MFVYQPLLEKLLLWLEFISALTAAIYYIKLKNTYWKWFIYYLVYIFLIEKFGDEIFTFLDIKKQIYFAYIGIPIEFVFFFWLYAIKSLKSTYLFFFCVLIYFISFLPIEIFTDKLKVVYSFNYSVGSFLLMLLVFFEFIKQIKNENILEFKRDKMFYINIGIMLFYVGTLPFFSLYNLLLKEPEIWNNYYLYFIISNCLMYLLFTISFIWANPKL